MEVLVLRNSGTLGSFLVVLLGKVDVSAAASGVSSRPGVPFSIALMRIGAATYPSMSTRKRSLPLATVFPPLSSIYCIPPTIKAEKTA